MDALILAGGLGTRLSKTISNKQKVVADINGKPFIIYLLEGLYSAGIRKVILALGYKAEETLKTILDFLPKDMIIISSVEAEPLGTAGAIRNALPLIQSDELLVANGDSIINFSLIKLINFHKKKNAKVSMLLCKVSDISRYGSVILDEKCQIQSFEEKTNSIKNSSRLINAGIYVFSKNIVAKMPLKYLSLEKDIFPYLCGNGLYGLETNSKFIDIGIPDEYQKAQNFFTKFYIKW